MRRIGILTVLAGVTMAGLLVSAAGLAAEIAPYAGARFVMAPPLGIGPGDRQLFNNGWIAQYMGSNQWVVLGPSQQPEPSPAPSMRITPVIPHGTLGIGSGRRTDGTSKTAADLSCGPDASWVKPYYEGDGTFVRGHCRRKSILSLFGLDDGDDDQ